LSRTSNADAVFEIGNDNWCWTWDTRPVSAPRMVNPVEVLPPRPGQLDQLRDCNVGQSLGLEHQFFEAHKIEVFVNEPGSDVPSS
jgi:hypothetical protein